MVFIIWLCILLFGCIYIDVIVIDVDMYGSCFVYVVFEYRWFLEDV